MVHKILLTFDVEDFINDNSIQALKIILDMLKRLDLRAIFFITGLMAEKLTNFPEILDSLRVHEIGYHSSSHSVRPTIPEYTDVEKYEDAYSISIERETSHINPLTGKVEAKGGIDFLRRIFPGKDIKAFRAPGNCWTPPNTEALRDLGIKFDFSAEISSEPVYYEGITYYPFNLAQTWEGSFLEYRLLLYSLLRHSTSILDLHPCWFVNEIPWDYVYYQGNPEKLHKTEPRVQKKTAFLFNKLELMLRRIKSLETFGLIELSPHLKKSSTILSVSGEIVRESYQLSVPWIRNWFHYNPRYLRNHFYRYFGL